MTAPVVVGDTTPLAAWVDAMVASMEEFAVSALGFEGVEVVRSHAGLPSDLAGAYVALVGDASSLQFGLVGDERACGSVARALLMMDGSEELTTDDLADAVNECANIIGGGIKSRMNEIDHSLKLGLPVFIRGSIQTTAQLEAWTTAVETGGIPLQLLVLRHRA